jgi:thioredoxin 1
MQELTTQEFSNAIAQGNAVVDFWAPWCGPCRMMAPVFDEMSKSQSGMTFAKVNVDEEGAVAQQLGIRGIPTIIFFKDGKEVGRHVGFADKRTLEAKLAATFG